MNESPPERYRSHRLISKPLGRDFVLAHSPDDSGDAELLPARVAEILHHCGELRSLDGHAASFARARGQTQEQRAAVREALGSLAESGHLYSEADVLAACRDAGGDAGERPVIRTVAVLTCGRPEALLRCVRSYAANVRSRQREVRFLVADDTREAAARDESRRRLAALAAELGVAVAYAGREEKRRFAERLAAVSGVPRRLVDFALFGQGSGVTIGGNRNAVLLAGAGELVLCTDDDVVCRTATNPEMRDGVDAPDGLPAWQTWFYEDRRRAVEAAHFVDLDLLAVHEQLLGRTTPACVAETAGRGRLEADRLGSDFVDRLFRGGGDVLVTRGGLVGDHGKHRPSSVLWLRGASRQRLFDSPADYRTACRGRDMVELVERPTLVRPFQCVATLLGLDGRRLLPPFFPVGRSEDILFGVTLAASRENAYLGVVPVAVLHDAAPRPPFADDTLWSSLARHEICRILGAVVGTWSLLPLPKPAAERLSRLGSFLIEVAGLPDAGYKGLIRESLWEGAHGLVSQLEATLREEPAPPGFWCDGVRRQIDVLHAAVAADDFDVPNDLAVADPDEARSRGRDLMRLFGELLLVWPELTRAARGLAGTEGALAAPL